MIYIVNNFYTTFLIFFGKDFPETRRTFIGERRDTMQPVEREIFKRKGKVIELYKLENGTYKAFAFENFDTDDEIVGVGESDERETAIKLALQDLYVEIKNTR